MKKLLFILGICVTLGACNTKQDVIDGGISSPYYDGNIMQYLRSNEEQWSYTVQMIERADLTELFEGRVDTAREITFFAPPSFSVHRYLMDLKYKAPEGERYESIDELPEDLCRELILKHVVIGKHLKEDMGFRNMDYDIHSPDQDGGTRLRTIGGCSLIGYREKSAYQGIPDAGPVHMFLYSVTAGRQIPLATPDIQPVNGVIHALNYGYDFGKI